MLDFLIDLDKSVLLFCNTAHTAWLDQFNWMITARWFNIFVALPLLFIMLHAIARCKKQGVVETILIVVALALAVLLADQIASSVFKPLFQRLRPSHDPSMSVVLVNDYRGGRFGFVSSHAANTFAAAVFLIRLFRNRYFACSILLWACSVSYSRIYLGVHFPGDILCGALLGIFVGYFIYSLYQRLRLRILACNASCSVTLNPYVQDDYARYFALYIPLLYIVIGIVAIV